MSESSSIDYNHPFGTPFWEWRVRNTEEWLDATGLSGYESGQGTRTLTLASATTAESGHIRCSVSGPDGKVTISDIAYLEGGEEVDGPVFVVHPEDLTLVHTITFTDHPEDLLLGAT